MGDFPSDDMSQGGGATGISQYTEQHPRTNHYRAQNVNSANAETPCSGKWSQNIHLNLHSHIHLHLVCFLPLPLLQSLLQASASTRLLWEPVYSENVESFPIKHS